MTKTRPKFISVLGIVSVLGFLAVFLNTTFQIDIGILVEGLIFIVMGVGLIIEGNYRALLKMAKGGLRRDEITHITAVVIGAASVSVGLLTIVDVSDPIFIGWKGLISIAAIAIIIFETWVVK